MNRLWAADDRGPVYDDGTFRFDAVADAGSTRDLTMPGVVDLHAHVVLADAFGTAGTYGPVHDNDADGVEFFRVGDYTMKPIPYRGSVFMDVERRLVEMDRVGIDRQMLSPNPLTFFGGIEPAPAIALRAGDQRCDGGARRAVPGSTARIGAAPDAGSRRLRSPNSIGRSAISASWPRYIGTDYGMTLDDRRFDDFYHRLVELDVPLFVHGVTNDGRGPAAMPDSVGSGSTSSSGTPTKRRWRRRHSSSAASSIGIPTLDVCLSHGGGAIAFLAQRFDSMAKFRGADSEFAASLRRLWFDSHLEPGPARDLVVDTVGVDRMVYGTNFGGWDTPTSTDDFDASLTPNAHRLLRLEATA